jgi:hypothetical protein
MRIHQFSLWGERRPPAAIRVLLYALVTTAAIALGILAFHWYRVKPVDDCNKPPAPVEVPQAPPGLIVDAPCTDGSAQPTPSRGR